MLCDNSSMKLKLDSKVLLKSVPLISKPHKLMLRVRSPIDGQVLKINTRPGEIISNTGIAELGRTQVHKNLDLKQL